MRAVSFLVTAAAALWAGLAAAQEDAATTAAEVVAGNGLRVEVPSGQEVTWQDVIWNVPGPDGMVMRFRFIAPGIADGGGVDFDTASADMQHLCDSFAVPRLPEFGVEAQQVVISLSASAVEFGTAAPDVVQFFESYSVVDGACQWEVF